MSLSPSQAEAYLDRISLPDSVRSLLREGPDGRDALKAVAALQQAHLASVPFENLDLCYSVDKAVSQDPDVVFDKVVNRRRGGVCDQIHPLFARLLRTFGFVAYLAGARLNAAAGILQSAGADPTKASFTPWIHVVTIITIGDTDYIVDTSHGPSGSPSPVPLVHDLPEVDMYPRQRRMMHQPLPGGSNPRQKWWCLQIRNTPGEAWLDVWSFTETEWFDADIQLLRLGYSMQGGGWVAPHVCCFRTVFENKKPVKYYLLLKDELRQWHKGKLSVLQRLHTEEERIQCISEYFSVKMTLEEQQGIQGHDACLQGDDFDYYG